MNDYEARVAELSGTVFDLFPPKTDDKKGHQVALVQAVEDGTINADEFTMLATEVHRNF